MKLITIILAFLSLQCFGQKQTPPLDIKSRFFALTPVNKNTIVSGITFGLTINPLSTDTLYVQTKGLNIEVGPLGIIGGIWGTTFGLYGVKDEEGNVSSFFSNHGYVDSSFTSYLKFGTHVTGVSISLFGLSETYNKGLILNGLSGYCFRTTGVQVSGLLNDSYEFKGLTIAGIGNVTTKGRGVQIGLINKCKTGNVIQIGLFNRIGKRVLPFFNMRIAKE